MKRALALALLMSLGFGSRAAFAGSGATVTEAVKEVDYGTSGSAHAMPAKVGTSLTDGDFLKTGAAARAELQFQDQTVTRLGANTIFNYSSASNEVDLQSGTILFSKKKDGRQLEIKTAAVTAAIVGTTGFAQAIVRNHQTQYLIGLIEGKAEAEAGKKHFTLHSGDLVYLGANGVPVLLNFDLPRLVRTSPLIIKFKGKLPNEAYIEAAVAQYEDDQRRGFIKPSNGQYTSDIYSVDIPAIPTVARDSAGNQLNQQNQPPPSPPPSNPNPYTPPPYGGGT